MRKNTPHVPSATDRISPPHLPRARTGDRPGQHRLGDPIAPPPLPRSTRTIDVEDRAIAPEPPPPAVDPFDDDDDDDDAMDVGHAGEGADRAPPVTFWLRGGRMRVPIAAAAIARADRRLSRLARKRGRRL